MRIKKEAGRDSTNPDRDPDQSMTLVFERVLASCPFEDRAVHKRSAAVHTCNIVSKYLEAGSNILDFGCGLCVKDAMLSLCGYDVYACDDYRDPWHAQGDFFARLSSFVKSFRVHIVRSDTPACIRNTPRLFDCILLCDVLEHLHSSPALLLRELLKLLRPGGIVVVTVPNAANVRKRVRLAFGRTNYPPFEDYCEAPGTWRGHIREYVRQDLIELGKRLGLRTRRIDGCCLMATKHHPVVIQLYKGATHFFPGLRDTWMVVYEHRQ